MAKILTEETIRSLRQEAETEIRAAEHTIATWRNVLSDLEATERVLENFFDEAPPRPAANIAAGVMSASGAARVSLIGGAGGGFGFSVRNPFRHNTNKAFAWEVLDKSPNPWLTANQIQERVSELKGAPVPMSSISPTLSEMKAQFVERKGMLVALKTRLNENEAPNGGAAGASETGGAATPSNHQPQTYDL